MICNFDDFLLLFCLDEFLIETSGVLKLPLISGLGEMGNVIPVANI